MPRQYRSPRTQLVEASGLGLKKSKDDIDQERWSVPGIWLDFRNGANRDSDVVVIVSFWITKAKRGQGHASRVLRALCEAADAKGIRLQLEAHAYGGADTLNTPALVAWYARYGFKRDSRCLSLTGRVPMTREVRGCGVRRKCRAA